VAEVSEDHSEAAQSILRYELETFVCDGQYEKGIETILDKFLLNLGSRHRAARRLDFRLLRQRQVAPGQDAAHPVDRLPVHRRRHRPQSCQSCPPAQFEHLKELSTQGKRHGALHAAAGKLGAGAGDKVRLALLGIMFKSKGCPSNTTRRSSSCG
jgi:hypothetical protein